MPEKKWVFNTVTLSNFPLSDSAFILKKRYNRQAIITSQVYDEISSGISGNSRLKSIDDLIKQKILRLHALSIQERNIYIELIGHLGKGEASCIAAAKVQSLIVATDDRTARKQCSQMGILVTGTIGILKASLLDDHLTIEQADEILTKMIQNGFYSPVRSMHDIA
jgi:predicted nucleic acid-binding protein